MAGYTPLARQGTQNPPGDPGHQVRHKLFRSQIIYIYYKYMTLTQDWKKSANEQHNIVCEINYIALKIHSFC